MDHEDSLSNQLLIAMPGMADPNFNSTVTLVCEHNAEGALGIVINRPMNLNLGGLLEQLSLDQADQAAANSPVLDGGPVGRERGFVLHNPHGTFETSVDVLVSNVRMFVSGEELELAAEQVTGPELVDQPDGPGSIETYTVEFERDGEWVSLEEFRSRVLAGKNC